MGKIGRNYSFGEVEARGGMSLSCETPKIGQHIRQFDEKKLVG